MKSTAWQTFLTTFGLIFLAELGDKTQLTAITLAAQTKSPVAVFLAASAALVVVSLIAVLVGSLLSEYIPVDLLRKLAGSAFVILGILMLLGKL